MDKVDVTMQGSDPFLLFTANNASPVVLPVGGDAAHYLERFSPVVLFPVPDHTTP